jgi:2-polyprenyl-3-methyl-5-hydroxy-6-metoxy-1,4-benzoquinol methylase
VGCGTGELLDRVAGRFKAAFGVDVDDDAISRCVTRFASHSNIVISKVSVTNLDCRFHPESFEWVTAMDIIEHLSAQEALEGLKQVTRVLKPGGHLLMTAPNWYDIIKIGLNAAGDHIQSHSSLGWAKMVHKAGLEVLRIGTIRFPFMDAAFLRERLHFFGMCVYVHAKKPL